MKKMVFCIIPLIMVIMGCASSGAAVVETNGNAGDTGAAAKLTADINAAKPGSTVTLSGWVGLETALTVPEGVTLDLTAEGAVLELQDGAVLTVNGTVNAKAEGINIDSTAENPATVNGSGTIQLKSKGRLLVIGESRKLTLDGVTLLGVDNNDEVLVVVGGEFVLKSGSITGNTRVSDGWAGGGGVGVYEGGSFTMSGGAVSGNSASSKTGGGAGGGGVCVSDGSTFTMQGGTISGNIVTGKSWAGGGGVNVGDSTFTMQGGTISGNTSEGFGGGVAVSRDKGVFIMQGGTIYGKADSLPAGTDASLANIARNGVSLGVWDATTKWGTSGTYTKGGAAQIGSDDIGETDDTLIAIPAK